MFSITEFGAATAQSRATSTGNASPQNKVNRKPGYIPALSTPKRRMKSAVDGTENHAVSWESLIKAPGLMSCFWLRQQTHAPFSQPTNISCADRSKVRSKVCEI